MLYDDEGNRLNSDAEISAEYVAYYTELFGHANDTLYDENAWDQM